MCGRGRELARPRGIAAGAGGAGGDECRARFGFHLAGQRELAAGRQRGLPGPRRVAAFKLGFGHGEKSARNEMGEAGLAGFPEGGLAIGKARLSGAGEGLGGAVNAAGLNQVAAVEFVRGNQQFVRSFPSGGELPLAQRDFRLVLIDQAGQGFIAAGASRDGRSFRKSLPRVAVTAQAAEHPRGTGEGVTGGQFVAPGLAGGNRFLVGGQRFGIVLLVLQNAADAFVGIIKLGRIAGLGSQLQLLAEGP